MMPPARQIRVIVPVTTAGLVTQDDYQAVAGPGTAISLTQIRQGPASIECELDRALAVPAILSDAIAAEKDGVQAIVIDCMGDPGLKPAREAVSIPVVGPAEASMHFACMLGHKFSVITVLDSVLPMFEDQARVYGVHEKMVSARSVNIPVIELERGLCSSPERLVSAMADQAVKAVEQDGAHVVILGCTGMFGFAQAIQKQMTERGCSGVPVLDPIPIAVRVAETLIDLGLRNSSRTYPKKQR